MPWQSGCSFSIPTASEKERAGFEPFTKQRNSFMQHGTKRQEEERAEISLFRHKPLHVTLGHGCTDKSKITALQSGFPCSPGKSRRLTEVGKKFFALLVGPESQMDYVV